MKYLNLVKILIWAYLSFLVFTNSSIEFKKCYMAKYNHFLPYYLFNITELLMWGVGLWVFLYLTVNTKYKNLSAILFFTFIAVISYIHLTSYFCVLRGLFPV